VKEQHEDDRGSDEKSVRRHGDTEEVRSDVFGIAPDRETSSAKAADIQSSARLTRRSRRTSSSTSPKRDDDDRDDLDAGVDAALGGEDRHEPPLSAAGSVRALVADPGATDSPPGVSGGSSTGTGRRRVRPTKIASRTLTM
jgi:hypothetical protein